MTCLERIEAVPQQSSLSSYSDAAGETLEAWEAVDQYEQQDLHTSVHTAGRVERSRLLLLPKELRLEIWKHVLVDPARPKRTLCIKRRFQGLSTSGKRFSNSLYKQPNRPEIDFSFHDRPNPPLNADVLRTNHLVYAEALPILYQSITFWPLELDGIFALFLERLSAFAKSHIRYIRLDICTALESTPGSFFYWALTCAQVAKLSESLRHVEVGAHYSLLEKDCPQLTKRALLYPLLKIKTPKLASGAVYDSGLQHLLVEAAEDLGAKIAVRRASTAADAAERARRSCTQRMTCDESARKKQKLSELALRRKPSYDESPPSTDEAQIAHALRELPGIKQFEKELLEWDMVSEASGSPCTTPRARSLVDEETWADTASTIVAKGNDSNDKEDEDWEHIDKPVSL
jgi:hypothetical protein